MKTDFMSRKSGLALLLRLWLVMVAMLGNGSVSVGNAAVIDCNQFYYREAFENYDRERIQEIQKHLRTIGYDPVQIDGIIGTKTISEIIKFCQDFAIGKKNNVSDELHKAVAHYAAIAEKHPGWKEIIASESFEKWNNKHTPEQQIHINKIQRPGAALLVTSLLDDINNHVDASAIQDCESSATDDQTSQHKSNDESGVFYRLTQQDLKELEKDLKELEAHNSTLQQLKSLLGVAYVNERLYKSAVCNALNMKPCDKSKDVVQKVVDQVKKKGDANVLLKLKAADDCGCARQWDSVGEDHFTVYGFYPSWMSAVPDEKADSGGSNGSSEQAEAESTKQHGGVAVNFSVLSRIGYFALELDNGGKIAGDRQWKGSAKAFIKIAHRYRSKVDLVIEARNWQSWDNGSLDRAVYSIWRLLDPAITPLPDGIALYFPDFLLHNGETGKIVTLMTKLHEKLTVRGAEKGFYLNIVLEAGDVGGDPQKLDPQGECSFLAYLKDLLVGDLPMVDLVLVFLDQPVTKSKKRLHRYVEDQFQGVQRKNVLRKIVPIIPLNGHREKDINPKVSYELGSDDDPYKQLQHDLVYFRDNFRGVAFWPVVPMARDEKTLEDLKHLQNRLVWTFAQAEETGTTHHGSGGRRSRAPGVESLCLRVSQPGGVPDHLFSDVGIADPARPGGVLELPGQEPFGETLLVRIGGCCPVDPDIRGLDYL